MVKQKLNYESRIDIAKQKIQEKPERALQEIGKFLVKEIRLNTPKGINKKKFRNKKGELIEVKPGRLRASVGYWYRKREKDLQVGIKSFYGPFIELGTSKNSAHPFFLKTVEQNVGVVQEMITNALKELTKDD